MRNPDTSFPLLESFANGLRLCAAHTRFFMMLSFLPFAVTLLTMVGLRLWGQDAGMFILPLVQLPSSFVIGLQTALILRFVLLHEYPILESHAEKVLRNRAVIQAALAHATVTYIVSGIYVGLSEFKKFADASPEAAAPWTPLLLAGCVLMFWGTRWFWLHVPVAMNWPVREFYDRVGRWTGSARIFVLFALCSLTLNIVASCARLAIVSVAGQNKTGYGAAFDDGVVAFASVMLGVLFAASTAAAVKSMIRAGKR